MKPAKDLVPGMIPIDPASRERSQGHGIAKPAARVG
jgi:hypothetical protein